MSIHDGVHRDFTARRQHVWYGDRCQRCQMHREWPGAREACEGVETAGELRARVYATKKRKLLKVKP